MQRLLNRGQFSVYSRLFKILDALVIPLYFINLFLISCKLIKNKKLSIRHQGSNFVTSHRQICYNRKSIKNKKNMYI